MDVCRDAGSSAEFSLWLDAEDSRLLLCCGSPAPSPDVVLADGVVEEAVLRRDLTFRF